jgi:hypothetical protein
VDLGGLATWSSQLDTGVPRDQVVLGIENAVGHEYYGDVVNNLYVTYLGRVPQAADNPGQYVNDLVQGMTVEQVAAIFTTSPEFFVRNGSTSAGFVNGLYLAALGTPNRVAADPVASSFAKQLDNGTLTPGQLSAIVFASTEYQQDLVRSIYSHYFDRTADASGLAIWAGQLASGVPDQEVLATMLGTPSEYFNKTIV